MDIRRIIVTGRLAEELEPLLTNERNREFRFVSERTLSQDLLNWADAFVGFQLYDGFDYRHLQWIHALGAGVDRFVGYLDPDGDAVLTRTVGPFGERITEYCLSYMLQDLQHHRVFLRAQREHKWSVLAPMPLKEQTVVIFGTGEIGRRVAETLATFGVKVCGVSLHGDARRGFSRVLSIRSIPSDTSPLSAADWVINTLPLTPATKELFDDRIFSVFNNVGLIQVGRGETVKTSALKRAMENKNVRFAVLDVFENEPLPADSDLWGEEDIRITPHIAALTTAAEAAESLLGTLRSMESGLPLTNRVNLKLGY
ncbi:D-2-hydroxyacid dehydrogenase [Alicyclobacillus dauci]|uniref:D-2-hydroxyacid dehydrogenase n=1 Tax=Alicyclobacillus dauci TaxID=1475485 RepID=A0ABY6Z7L9_9BACL|nr:D-2-hydroxyacid dehydrogenase [Alicyclobacillus dauci]WAH38884.1 D-2-hydroxyacid dehydrogenase [Alicyclobacillus dauci]